MNCLDCRGLIQSFLDGELSWPADAELQRHLATCAVCRELHAASGRLADGLRLLIPPAPPAGLADRIVASGLAQYRRARRFRQGLAAGALAASLLLISFAVYSGLRPVLSADRTAPFAERHRPNLLPPAPSLQRSVEEAGEAVAVLTRRATDESVGQTRLLLPAVLPEPLMADTELVQKAMEPPAQSLREVRQGVAEGLEPVTTSARRAVSLFLREIPPRGSSLQ
jgi:anti-sigma factor RsiW